MRRSLPILLGALRILGVLGAVLALPAAWSRAEEGEDPAARVAADRLVRLADRGPDVEPPFLGLRWTLMGYDVPLPEGDGSWFPPEQWRFEEEIQAQRSVRRDLARWLSDALASARQAGGGPGSGAGRPSGARDPAAGVGAEAGWAADLLLRVAVEVEVRRPDGTVERGVVRAAPRRVAFLDRTRVLTAVTDLTPEMACDNSGGLHPSAIENPVVTELRDGTAVAVRPFVLEEAGGRRIALEAFVQVGRIDRPVVRLATEARHMGDVELPDYRGAFLLFSGATAPGEAIVARARTADGEVEVRLVPRLEEAGPGPQGPFALRAFDVGLLEVPPVVPVPDPYADLIETAYALGFSRAEEPRAVAPGAAGALLADAAPGVAALALAGGVHLAGTQEDVDRARDLLAVLQAPSAVPTDVEIVARAGDEEVASVRMPALPGRPAFLRYGRDRWLLLDADVEVG